MSMKQYCSKTFDKIDTEIEVKNIVLWIKQFLWQTINRYIHLFTSTARNWSSKLMLVFLCQQTWTVVLLRNGDTLLLVPSSWPHLSITSSDESKQKKFVHHIDEQWHLLIGDYLFFKIILKNKMNGGVQELSLIHI